MPNALILWSSRTGNTTKIAEYIAEGLKNAGCDTNIRDAKYVEDPSELDGYDALILGSSTYHGEMNPPMKKLLFMLEKVAPRDVAGGAFGAFEWSGEAPGRIFDTMRYVLKMKMPPGPLPVKSATGDDCIEMARAYGREIADLLS